MALGGNTSNTSKRSEEETFGDLYSRSFGFFPGGRAAMKGLYDDLIERGHTFHDMMRGLRALCEGNAETKNKQPLAWDIIRAIEQTRPRTGSSKGCPYCQGSGTLPVLKETFKNVFRSPKDTPSHEFHCGIVYVPCVCKGTDRSILELTADESMLWEFIRICDELRHKRREELR